MTSSSFPSQVSIFGLGAMGVVLGAQFAKKGYYPTVWNRSSAKVEKFVLEHPGQAYGATTVAQALEASKVTILCLLDNKAVRETLDKALPSLAGRIIVNLTNGTPEDARETSAFVTAQGAQYVHGGIMATPSMIATPASVLLYSGSQETYAAVEDDLAILGAGKFLGTDAGVASLYDLALLSGMYGLLSGFIHATSLVRFENQTMTEFMTLLGPWLSNMVKYLDIMAKQIDEGDYSPLGSSLEMQVPAIENIVKASQTQGVSADLIRPIQKLVDRAVAAGRGDNELSVLVEEMDITKK
ncbi:hypothetical protein BGZ51_009344 [Haplosporangium sp. Z 767]|nr:hypothetical protein BGZ50_002371 [Haplosporangium sp. Z 11]KAF9189703.1 hypothetical protein BGZ51_009344 [Haplosporangium sp. Z 767]